MRTYASSIAAATLLLVAAPAFAQTAAELEASAAIEADMTAPSPIRALNTVRERAEQIRDSAQNARVDLRADTRAELQAASSTGEKKSIIRTFVDERLNIAGDRAASTSQLRRAVRSAIRWHGGFIRERFVVATRQFDRIIVRIESRIGKLQAEGVATASVEAELQVARTAVAQAKVDAKAVADFVAGVGDAADREAVKAELEAKVRVAQNSLKAAHQALVSTVRTLVALTSRPSVNATTSIETSI